MQFSYIRGWLIILIVGLVWGGLYLADALSQSQKTSTPEVSAIALFDIPKTLEKINLEEQRLRTELDSIPSLSEPLQFDAYGYHGGYLPALSELPDTPRWTVDIRFQGHSQTNPTHSSSRDQPSVWSCRELRFPQEISRFSSFSRW